MDFAIGLSLVNGISGQINQIIGDFRRLDGVTDEVMKQLSQFKNISIAGGLLAGAGVKGLQATLDVLDDCIDKAATLQSTSLDLKISMFGNDLLEQSKLPEIEEKMDEIEAKAMEISLNTTFNQNEIEQSMLALSRAGMSVEDILSFGAEANANFAQIKGVSALDTAEATSGFSAGFGFEGKQIADSFDLITKYAHATRSDALDIQQNIGNMSGTAMAVWKGRDNMEITEDSLRLVTATNYVTQDARTATTYVRNFLDALSSTHFTSTQEGMMTNVGWLTEDGKNIFVEETTGVLKSVAEIEKILENTAEKMHPDEFNTLVSTVTGKQGAKTALALAEVNESKDTLNIAARADTKLGVSEQVARQMETAVAQMGILNEAIDTLKATVGKPFLEPIAKMLKVINPQLAVFAKYLKQHPEVVKFMAVIAAGASSFLILAGGIMLAIGLVGSFKLIWAKAGAQIVAHFAPILSTLGIVTAVIAVIAGLAFVVYRNWNTLKPHFAGIWENIKQILSIAKQNFGNFADIAGNTIGKVLNIMEKGAMIVLGIVLPIVNTALSFLVDVLNYDVIGAFQNVWANMSPLARLLTTIFAPSIAIVTGTLIIMGATAVVSAAQTIAFAVAGKVAAVAMGIYRGVIAAATAIQTIWNIAMTGGVAATVAQKLAVAALYPVIMIVKAAQAIWTGVQWALNIAMNANPIGLVIIAIAGLITIVALVIKYFKDFTEWVQKGWDKLKNFLGFKREHKDELEAPIETEISQTENIEKKVSVTTNKSGFMQNLGADVSRYMQKGMNGMELTPEVLLNPEYQMNVAENQKKMQSIMEGISFSFVGKSFGDMKQKISEQFADVKTSVEQNFDFANMNYTMPDMTGNLEEMKNVMQTGGTDAGNAFADALAATSENVATAIQSINSIIESTLLNKEQMYLWGSNLMQSFINGMNSQKVNLMTTAATLAITIGDYLKVESPSRKGELKTNHLWGGNLIKSFADGMKKQKGLLHQTSLYIAKQTNPLNGIDIENWRKKDDGFIIKNRAEKQQENANEQRPIYIVIQGAEKRENEIAKEVARELEKRGYGKKKKEKSPSLTMSPYKILGGY